MEKEELHFATDENKTRDLVDACCGWSPYDQSRHRLSVYVSLYVSVAFANVLGMIYWRGTGVRPVRRSVRRSCLGFFDGRVRVVVGFIRRPRSRNDQ